MSSRYDLYEMTAMLSMALGVIGCVSSGPEVGAAEIEQAVMTYGYSLGVTTTSSIPIGTSVDRTCFLSGVAGNLQPPESDLGVPAPGADLWIDDNNDYHLTVTTYGRELNVFAQCVNTAAGRTAPVQWITGGPGDPNNGAKWLASLKDHPYRRCFLTGIHSGYRPEKSGFVSNDDYVQIITSWDQQNGYQIYLGGVQSNVASATAQCIDVNVDYGSWQWTAADPGARQDPLSNTAGISCPLTGIGGHFNQDAWLDGAYTSLETGINQFYMNTTNGHTGWTTCVK
jgi:hypothetical protein